MSEKSTATQNNAPIIICKAPDDVKCVIPLPDYCLQVEFMDGTLGAVYMKERISSPEAGVFKALKDPDLFKQAHIEYGVVTWPGEIDLSPHVMYQTIKKAGVWILK